MLMGRSLTLLPWFAQTLLLLLLQHHHLVHSYAGDNNHLCPATQQLALFQFKQSLSINPYNNDFLCDGLSYRKINEWEMSGECCTWDGVTCDPSTGDVIGLDLSCSRLDGVLHSNSSLFRLPHLQRLNLGFNNFYGSVLPHEIGLFATSLTHLNLSRCGFKGSVPSEIWHLSKLVSLDLSQNLLRLNFGSNTEFPNHLQSLTQLRVLSLGGMSIDSVLSKNLSSLSSLTFLDLSYTGLRGKLPSEVFHLPNSLTYLDLSSNSLSGPLPSPNICRLQKLKFLDLSDNSLSGEIPSWVFDLPLLENLYLFWNQFKGELHEFRLTNSLRSIRLSGNELIGSIPQSILRQSDLQLLDLSGNKLSGPIEIEMFSILKKLESLVLSDNQFSVRMTNSVNNIFPNLKNLGLSSLSMNEFPYFLRTTNKLEGIDLSDNQIHGRFPEWLCNSSRLASLDLSRNSFSGVLPHCLGNLGVSLELIDLSMNTFHASIPSTFANLRDLRYLNLHGNQLEGDVPSLRNCTSLAILDLGSNKLKGTFPYWLESLPMLNAIVLGSNEFHGEIPNALTNLFGLEYLDLHKNDFQGTIPSMCITSLNYLKSLNLHGNRLHGTIPSSLANCTQLEVLDLGKNNINDTFPSWLDTLPELHVLVLSFNRFHGPINISSTTKSPFPKLRILDLSSNDFTGFLPDLLFKNFKAMEYVDESKKETECVDNDNKLYYFSVELVMKGVSIEIDRILTILTTIDLSNNQFKGEIPKALGNLKFLRQLNLSHNNLVGRIPSVLGNLSVLEVLDLNSNQLNGEIPPELTNLNSLAKLNLSYNQQLTGRIPSGKQFNSFMNDSYYGDAALCGFPVSICEKDEHPQMWQGENDSGFMNGFTWQVVLLGYGCGIVLGFLIGCFKFSVGKPKWFTGIVHREVRMMGRRTPRSGYRRSVRRN